MQAMTAKRQYNLQSWSSIIRECKNSGIYVKDWCAEHDVNVQQFYYWQRQIREELSSSLESESSDSVNFVRLDDNYPKGSNSYSTKPDMALNMGNIQLEINNTASPKLIADILQVLAHA